MKREVWKQCGEAEGNVCRREQRQSGQRGIVKRRDGWGLRMEEGEMLFNVVVRGIKVNIENDYLIG